MFEWLYKLLGGEPKLCCPRCKRQFNDWFIVPVWNKLHTRIERQLRYCYPCSGFGNEAADGVITEEVGVWCVPRSGESL